MVSYPIARIMVLVAALAVPLSVDGLVTHAFAGNKFSEFVSVDPGKPIRIRLEALYSTAPPSGFLPVRVYLSNHSGKARVWTFKATHDDYGGRAAPAIFTQELTVADQAERVFELYVPMLSTMSAAKPYASWGQRIQIGLSGYGIRNATLRGSRSPTSTRTRGKQTLPFIAMSADLHLRSWPVLAKAFETAGYIMTGSSIQPEKMPTDWRGYVGLWALQITEGEWSGLPAVVRSAVIDWVSMGGRLYIFHRDVLPQTGRDYGGFRFEPATGNRAKADLGLGRIGLLTWDGREIQMETQRDILAERLNPDPPPLFNDYSQDYTRERWPLISRMPEIQFSGPFITVLVIFLLLYFVMAGPLNLWVFARRERRLLLFLTTPVLAVTCGALLCLLLILREGFGGWGYRTTGVYLLPNAKKAVVVQEQIARTALLLATDFTVDKAVFMTPIRFAEAFGKERPTFKLTPQRFVGDWFANSSLQAHFIELLQPTRAAIHRLPPAAHRMGKQPDLTILSSINTTLQELYVRDATGAYWHGRHIPPGRNVTLRRSSRLQYDSWRRNNLADRIGPRLAQSIRHLEAQPNVFVGVAADAPGFVVETLPAIDWLEQTIILFGHFPSAAAAGQAGTWQRKAGGGAGS